MGAPLRDQGEAQVERPRRSTPWVAVARFSLRNLTTALVVALLVAGVAAGLVLAGPERYVSTATMVIDNPQEIAAATGPGPLEKLSALRFKYAALVDTTPIVRPVSERLEIPAGEVAGATRAVAGAQSLVLFVTATTEAPERSQQLATATAEQLTAFVQQEHEANGVAAGNRFRLETVVEAQPGHKTAPTQGRAVAVAAVAGAIALAAAYLVLQLVTADRRH